MKPLLDLYNKIPNVLRNKYAFTLMAVFVWMLFFDDNNFISQIKLRMELSELQEKKAYFIQKTEEIRYDQAELLTTEDAIQKFAREKYWMKKDNEDIFVIVEARD